MISGKSLAKHLEDETVKKTQEKIQEGVEYQHTGIFADKCDCENCTQCISHSPATGQVLIEIPKGYEKYGEMFQFCLNHTAKGKGHIRHGNGKPFHKQIICVETAEEGHGFARGQAKKKITEAKRLEPEAAIREIAGAVNYLIADMIVMREEGKEPV